VEDQVRYSEHIDYLIAAVVYLGTSAAAWARTAPNMARDLSLDPEKLQAILDGFPGIFRKSWQTDDDGLPYYSLQARYALRTEYGPVERSTEIDPLPVENVKLIYDFIQRSADDERAGWRTLIGNSIAVTAAVVSAATAILVAILEG
jgi:hypothetical protein